MTARGLLLGMRELTILPGDRKGHANDAVGVRVVILGWGQLYPRVWHYDIAVPDSIIADIAVYTS